MFQMEKPCNNCFRFLNSSVLFNKTVHDSSITSSVHLCFWINWMNDSFVSNCWKRNEWFQSAFFKWIIWVMTQWAIHLWVTRFICQWILLLSESNYIIILWCIWTVESIEWIIQSLTHKGWLMLLIFCWLTLLIFSELVFLPNLYDF